MTKPFDFQAEDLNRVDDFNGRCLVSWEMGLGKSFLALLHAQRHDLNPMVVVCPASVKWQWAQQASHHVGWRAEVLSGVKPPEEGLPRKSRLYVINYDILAAGHGGTAKEWPWVKWLRDLKPELVVFDEAHMAMSRSAKRSRAVNSLCRGVKHVLGLTGTPLVNRPAELWMPLHIIRPDLFPAFWPFAQQFCNPKRNHWGGWDFKGATDLGTLHSNLTAQLMIRRRKEDVLKDLPKKRRIVLPLKLSDRREYEKATDDFLAWLAENWSQGRAKRAARAEAVTQLGYLKRLAAKLKMPSVLEWIGSFLRESDGKLVLFTVHRKIMEMLKEAHPNAAAIDGSTSHKERGLAVERFQQDAKCRLFVGQVQVAGLGLDGLQRACSDAAFVELPWSPGAVAQAEGRLDRIGQKLPVSIHFLVAKETVEERLLKLLQKKSRVIGAVLDGNGRNGDFDVFDMLTRQMRKDHERETSQGKNPAGRG